MTLPEAVNGQRVVCVFPILGDTGIVEADIVTVGDGPVFVVRRWSARTEQVLTLRGFTTLPAAVRQARKNAGWG